MIFHPKFLRRFAASVCRLAIFIFASLLILSILPTASRADDVQATASQLSDSAFRLLNSINSGSGNAGAILAPVASLAGDAQTLSTALSANDHEAAGRAMASIVSDRAQINSLMAGDSAAINRAEWNALKEQIGELEKKIPAAKVARAPAKRDAERVSASVSPPPSERLPATPKIQIASRVFKDEAVRVKGFLQGTDLKSAGIYDGDQKSKDIDVASTHGEQRVNFDFTIRNPAPDQSIRVADIYGREARAKVANSSMAATTRGGEELIEVDPGAGSSGSIEGPIASSGPAPRNNTAEIPRPSDEASPSRRRMGAGPSLGALTDVQINVIDAEEVMSAPGNVEVIGQIAGRNVRRAGVYVNGALTRSIPISAGGFSGFDVTFPMPPRSDAKIRAYGNGSDFVEASIDTTGNGSLHSYDNPPMYEPPGYPSFSTSPYARPNPYAYGTGTYTYGGSPYAYGANPNPYATTPYPNGYGSPPYYGPPPYGSPPPGYGYPPQPAPSGPWWSKIFH